MQNFRKRLQSVLSSSSGSPVQRYFFYLIDVCFLTGMVKCLPGAESVSKSKMPLDTYTSLLEHTLVCHHLAVPKFQFSVSWYNILLANPSFPLVLRIISTGMRNSDHTWHILDFVCIYMYYILYSEYCKEFTVLKFKPATCFPTPASQSWVNLKEADILWRDWNWFWCFQVISLSCCYFWCLDVGSLHLLCLPGAALDLTDSQCWIAAEFGLDRSQMNSSNCSVWQ